MRHVIMATLIVLGATLAPCEAQIDTGWGNTVDFTDGDDTDDIAECQSDDDCTGDWICVGIGLCVPPADSGCKP